MPTPYKTWTLLLARVKKVPPLELILPYSYGGFKGSRKVGVIRGAFFETVRTDKHYCVKYQGFGISYSVLVYLLDTYPRVDYVVIKYEGKTVDKTYITKLTDFVGGVRDRLSPGDDEQVFLREDQFRTVVDGKWRVRHGKKKRHNETSKEDGTEEREEEANPEQAGAICDREVPSTMRPNGEEGEEIIIQDKEED